MAAIQERTPLTTSWSASGSTKSLTIPSTWQVGDLAVMIYAAFAASPDSNPAGWTVLWDGTFNAHYVRVWVKRIEAADITSTVTVTAATSGKGVMVMKCKFSSAGTVSVSTLVANSSGGSDVSSYPIGTLDIPGTSGVESFLLLKDKDTTGGVSAFYEAPAGLVYQDKVQATGSNQITVAWARSADVAAGSFGSGLQWNVTQADNITPALSPNGGTLTFAFSAMLRPTGNGVVPVGTTYTGGADAQSVLGDEDPGSYMEFTGTSQTVKIPFTVTNGIIPEAAVVEYQGVNAPASMSVSAYLDLGSTELLSLGTDTNVYATRTVKTWSLAALNSTQKSAILADPTNLILRLVCTVT